MEDALNNRQGTDLLQRVQSFVGIKGSGALATARGETFAAPDLPDTAIPANDRTAPVMTKEFTQLAKEDPATLQDAISTPTGSRTYFLLTNGTTWYADVGQPYPRRVPHLEEKHVTDIALARVDPELTLDTEPPLSAIVRSDDGVAAAAHHGDTPITLRDGVSARQVAGYVLEDADRSPIQATVVLGTNNKVYVAANGAAVFALSLSAPAGPVIESIDEISSEGYQIFALCNNRRDLFTWGSGYDKVTAELRPKTVRMSSGVDHPTVNMLSGRYVLLSNKILYYVDPSHNFVDPNYKTLVGLAPHADAEHPVYEDARYVSHYIDRGDNKFGTVVIYGDFNPTAATVTVVHDIDGDAPEEAYVRRGGNDLEKAWCLSNGAIAQDTNGEMYTMNAYNITSWPLFKQKGLQSSIFKHAPHLKNMGTRSGYMQQLLRDAVPDGNIEKQTKYGMTALVACMTSCCRMDDPIAQLAAFMQEDNSQSAVDTAARRAHPVLYLAAACTCESLLYDEGQCLPIRFGAGKLATLDIVLGALERANSTITREKPNAARFWGTDLATKLVDEIPRVDAIDRMLETLLRAAPLGAGAGVVDTMDVYLRLRLQFT